MSVARLLLGLLGAVLMAWGIGVPLLGLFGSEAPATVTHVRRLLAERNEALRNRFDYSVSYRFTLPDGRTVEGTTNMVGDYANAPGLRAAQPFRVRYAPFWPRLNTPSIQARPNLEHLIVTGVGWMLAFGLWRGGRKRKGGGKPRKGKANGPPTDRQQAPP